MGLKAFFLRTGWGDLDEETIVFEVPDTRAVASYGEEEIKVSTKADGTEPHHAVPVRILSPMLRD